MSVFRLVPLSDIRLWCRCTKSWVAFVTRERDRYLVSADGYFIELPDGALAVINPRVVFPSYRKLPTINTQDLVMQLDHRRDSCFLAVPVEASSAAKPRVVGAEEFASCRKDFGWWDTLGEIEQLIALKAMEYGLVPEDKLIEAIAARGNSRTLGAVLVHQRFCTWEELFAACVDAPPATDSHPDAANIHRRPWELLGEVLVGLKKIRRTDLERALKAKRDGNQAIGQILKVMGACSEEQIAECLRVQKQLRQQMSKEVALVGQLLVSQGMIGAQQLEDAMRNQKVGRQSLERILIGMGICRQADINDYMRLFVPESFQAEVDDIKLGEWLVKTGTITQQQFDEALRIQMRGRQVLGELLVSMRLCSSGDIDKALRLQKSIRDSYHIGVEMLGSLLLKRGQVDAETLEKALQLQSTARQPIGYVLCALGACSTDDVALALQLQRDWRERLRPVGDRLADLLLKNGIVQEEQLRQALLLHTRGHLGRSLVERQLCTPEQIIETLIARDISRREQFQQFLNEQLGPPARESVAVAAAKPEKASMLGRLSVWFKKPR